MAQVDKLGRAMEIKAATCRSGDHDEQVGRVGGQLVPGQRCLGDFDGPVHHREAAQLRHRGLADVVSFTVVILSGRGCFGDSAEPVEH